MIDVHTADRSVVVIGAGQAGLSAAHHLRRRGLAAEELTVLDAEDGPGGAWRHRWPSLTLSTVNGVHDLPGMAMADTLGAGEDPTAVTAASAVPRYYAAYEQREGLAVRRPVRTVCVTEPGPGDPAADPRGGPYRIETDTGEVLTARGLVNATGTWTRPFIPHYPGAATFSGRRLHTRDFRGPDEFAGQTVVVVGGGISALDHLADLAGVAQTVWVTRTPPIFSDEPFTPEVGRAAVARVEDRVRRGLPPGSVVSVTGLLWTDRYRRAARLGALDRREMFTRITATGVAWDDGTEIAADAILWATGFRSSLDHLAPLGLRGPGGGITMDGRLATRVAGRPTLHLAGYGPSASTIGANRAGRAVAAELLAALEP